MNVNENSDGKCCINIFSKGKTELGRLLSNFAYTPFAHPKYGNFDTVEGFWMWMKFKLVDNDEIDYLRTCTGAEAKKYANKHRIELPDEHFDEFKLEIDTAIKHKLLAHKELALMLYDNGLPLIHYYQYDDRITMLPKYDWLVNIIKKYQTYLVFNNSRKSVEKGDYYL